MKTLLLAASLLFPATFPPPTDHDIDLVEAGQTWLNIGGSAGAPVSNVRYTFDLYNHATTTMISLFKPRVEPLTDGRWEIFFTP